MSDHDLSAAYLRLRAMIPGAYDTPNAPTPEQVWEVTEAALRRLLSTRITARQGERELCAREIEARACRIRDHGQKTPEGLLTAMAGAQLDALLDAAAALRNGDTRARTGDAP